MLRHSATNDHEVLTILPQEDAPRLCHKCGGTGPFYATANMQRYPWCIACKRAANLASYYRTKAQKRAQRAARGELLRKDINAQGRAETPDGWKWCPFCQSYHRLGAFRLRAYGSKTGRASYCRRGTDMLKRVSDKAPKEESSHRRVLSL